MPQIPMYDAPLVRAAGLPNAGLNVQAPNLGAAIGQGVQQASGIIAQVQEKARAEADQTVVLQKLNALQQYRNGMDEQMQKLVGSDIQDPDKWGGEKGQPFADFRTAKTSEQLGLLSQDMTQKQKQMFDQHAIPALEADRHRSTMHEFEQIQKVKVGENETAISTQGDAAELAVEKNGNFGWDKFEEARFQAEQAGRRIAALRGTDPNEEAKKAVSYVTLRTANTLLLRSNSTDAQRLIESYADTMTPEVRDHFLAKAKGVNDANAATDLGNTALAASRNDYLKVIDLEKVKSLIEAKDADGKFIYPPEIRENAKSKAEHDAGVIKRNWEMQDQATLQPVLRALIDGSASRSTLLDRIRQLPIGVEAATQATSAVHGWFSQRRAEARADAEPIYSQGQKAQMALNYYNAINDPNFAKMTDAQILSKVPELGLQGTIQIMADLQSVRTNPQKINQIHLDQEVAESSAKEFGLITGDKPTPAEKMKIAMMQAQAKAIIQASGKPAWPYEEQRKLYQELSKQIVTSPGFIWDTKKPFFEARMETQVPPAYVTFIQDGLKKAGQAPAGAPEILQSFIADKAAGLVDENGKRTAKANPAPPPPVKVAAPAIRTAVAAGPIVNNPVVKVNVAVATAGKDAVVSAVDNWLKGMKKLYTGKD